jgi:hypothetical protein
MAARSPTPQPVLLVAAAIRTGSSPPSRSVPQPATPSTTSIASKRPLDPPDRRTAPPPPHQRSTAPLPSIRAAHAASFATYTLCTRTAHFL